MLLASISEREKEILRCITRREGLSIPKLSGLLNVSTTTIRKDLKRMATEGIITLHRGRIMPAFHPNILAKQDSMVGEKNRIARKAAEMIRDNDIIMIGAGTTAALIVRYLLGKSDVRIISHSSLVPLYARTNPKIRLTQIGGEFLPYTESYVGPHALEQLGHFNCRVAFLGTDGISLDDGLSAFTVEDAAIHRKIADRSKKTVIVADSSKYGRRGFIHPFPLEKISILICDKNLPEDACDELRSKEIEVILV